MGTKGCKHTLSKRPAWEMVGLYVTCAICKKVADSPGIYECRKCRIFICTSCAVQIETQEILDQVAPDDDDKTLDVDTFDVLDEKDQEDDT